MALHRRVVSWSQVHAEEQALGIGIGKVADDLADGRRVRLDQRRHGHDLVVDRHARVLQQVHDLDVVPARQPVGAGALEVCERADARGRAPPYTPVVPSDEDAPFELGTDGPRSILLGVDGSATAARAGWYAAGLARRKGPV